MMMGLNINCKYYDFIKMILDGRKTIETRNKNVLKSYVGKRIGLIQTGKGKAKLVGYATISDVIHYGSYDLFRHDYKLHRVEKGSEYDFVDKKYGYVLTDVIACEPIKISSAGIVVRRIA